MPAKRDRGTKPASDENRHDGQNRSRRSPAFPYEADENSQQGYDGYDEEKNSFDPRYQQDFDVDENDINERKDEYRNLKNDISSAESENTPSDEQGRNEIE